GGRAYERRNLFPYTSLLIEFLSYEVEQLIGSTITNTFDINVNYFQPFDKFLVELYEKLRVALPYKTIGLYKLGDDSFQRFGKSPLTPELKNGSQFFDYALKSVFDNEVTVQSTFDRRETIDTTVSSNTPIFTAIIVPMVLKHFFTGAIVLCTGF